MLSLPAFSINNASIIPLSSLSLALHRNLVCSKLGMHLHCLQWSHMCPPALLFTAQLCSRALSLKQRSVLSFAKTATGLPDVNFGATHWDFIHIFLCTQCIVSRASLCTAGTLSLSSSGKSLTTCQVRLKQHSHHISALPSICHGTHGASRR